MLLLELKAESVAACVDLSVARAAAGCVRCFPDCSMGASRHIPSGLSLLCAGRRQPDFLREDMLSGRLPRGVNPAMLAAMAAMQRGQSQAFRGEERYLEPSERGWDGHTRWATHPCSVETCTGPPSTLPGREQSVLLSPAAAWQPALGLPLVCWPAFIPCSGIRMLACSVELASSSVTETWSQLPCSGKTWVPL